MDFTISTNHPQFPLITRTATLTNMALNTMTKELVLSLKINHFLDGVEIPEMVKSITSTADNSFLVVVGAAPEPYTNELGELITPEAPMVGEYDYWFAAYSSGASLKQMLEGGIANLVNNGSLDAKAYNL